MKFAISLLTAVPLLAFAANNSPEGAAEAFYRWVLTHDVTGLPSPAQRKQLRPLITPEFLRILSEAERAQGRCIARSEKDMKPDIWEGSLFVSNYEGANEVWYGEKSVVRQDVFIQVNLLDIDPTRGKGDRYRTIVWGDSVKLRKVRDGWLVADVLRGDSPGVRERESVIGMLRKYIDKDCSP